MGENVSKIDFKGGKMAEEGQDVVAIDDGGGKKKLIMIILVLLVVLVMVAGIWWWFFLRSSSEEEGYTKPADIEDSMQESSQKGEGELKNPIFSEALSFTVNLKDGKRFLRVAMRAAVEDPQALEFLIGRAPMVKDAIITTLQNKTTGDLRDHNGILNLKRDLRGKLNALFTEEFIKNSDSGDRTPIKKIMFEEFLLQ